MEQGARNAQLEELRRTYPSLSEQFDAEVLQVSSLRRALLTGPYPGLGKHHPDLFKAFIWRFWHLIRTTGSVGVVLPRAVFTGPGTHQWRETVLTQGTMSEVCVLVNTSHWVFGGVHPQKPVCLVAFRKTANSSVRLGLSGPYYNLSEFEATQHNHEVSRGRRSLHGPTDWSFRCCRRETPSTCLLGCSGTRGSMPAASPVRRSVVCMRRTPLRIPPRSHSTRSPRSGPS